MHNIDNRNVEENTSKEYRKLVLVQLSCSFIVHQQTEIPSIPSYLLWYIKMYWMCIKSWNWRVIQWHLTKANDKIQIIVTQLFNIYIRLPLASFRATLQIPILELKQRKRIHV